MRFVTFLPPAFVNVLPYQAVNTPEVGEELGLPVYAGGDVQLQRELCCVFRYGTRVEDATQDNLFVRLDLRRGWNWFGASTAACPGEEWPWWTSR